TQAIDPNGENYARFNFADWDRNAIPEPYCIVGGVVVAVDGGTVPQVLSPSEPNRAVVQAALSRDQRRAALVTSDHRLRLRQAGENGGAPTFSDVRLSGQRWSRPAFLPLDSRRVLVVVDGVLYAVTWPGAVSTVATQVTAFAVGPDGYRIAVVSGAGVGMGVLRETGDRLSLSPLRPLDAGLRDITGVAWVTVDRVIVAGRTPGGYGLTGVSVDGPIMNTWDNTLNSPIASVVAYAKRPTEGSGPGRVMVQTDKGEAYRVFVKSNGPLTTQDRSPLPSPSGSAPPVTKPPPTAPF